MLAKTAILANFAKVEEEMVRANKLNKLERPCNVGENGDIGKSLPRVRKKW